MRVRVRRLAAIGFVTAPVIHSHSISLSLSALSSRIEIDGEQRGFAAAVAAGLKLR
jgi:hypothetical protein